MPLKTLFLCLCITIAAWASVQPDTEHGSAPTTWMDAISPYLEYTAGVADTASGILSRIQHVATTPDRLINQVIGPEVVQRLADKLHVRDAVDMINGISPRTPFKIANALLKVVFPPKKSSVHPERHMPTRVAPRAGYTEGDSINLRIYNEGSELSSYRLRYIVDSSGAITPEPLVDTDKPYVIQRVAMWITIYNVNVTKSVAIVEIQAYDRYHTSNGITTRMPDETLRDWHYIDFDEDILTLVSDEIVWLNQNDGLPLETESFSSIQTFCAIAGPKPATCYGNCIITASIHHQTVTVLDLTSELESIPCETQTAIPKSVDAEVYSNVSSPAPAVVDAQTAAPVTAIQTVTANINWTDILVHSEIEDSQVIGEVWNDMNPCSVICNIRMWTFSSALSGDGKCIGTNCYYECLGHNYMRHMHVHELRGYTRKSIGGHDYVTKFPHTKHVMLDVYRPLEHATSDVIPTIRRTSTRTASSASPTVTPTATGEASHTSDSSTTVQVQPTVTTPTTATQSSTRITATPSVEVEQPLTSNIPSTGTEYLAVYPVHPIDLSFQSESNQPTREAPTSTNDTASPMFLQGLLSYANSWFMRMTTPPQHDAATATTSASTSYTRSASLPTPLPTIAPTSIHASLPPPTIQPTKPVPKTHTETKARVRSYLDYVTGLCAEHPNGIDGMREAATNAKCSASCKTPVTPKVSFNSVTNKMKRSFLDQLNATVNGLRNLLYGIQYCYGVACSTAEYVWDMPKQLKLALFCTIPIVAYVIYILLPVPVTISHIVIQLIAAFTNVLRTVVHHFNHRMNLLGILLAIAISATLDCLRTYMEHESYIVYTFVSIPITYYSVDTLARIIAVGTSSTTYHTLPTVTICAYMYGTDACISIVTALNPPASGSAHTETEVYEWMLVYLFWMCMYTSITIHLMCKYIPTQWRRQIAMTNPPGFQAAAYHPIPAAMTVATAQNTFCAPSSTTLLHPKAIATPQHSSHYSQKTAPNWQDSSRYVLKVRPNPYKL